MNRLPEAVRFDFQKHLDETQQLTHVGSWEWNVKTDTILWSDEHYRIFGFRPGEFSPSFRAVLPYIHKDDLDTMRECVERSIASHTSFACEYRIVRADGVVRSLHSRGDWSRGARQRMYGTVQDVTDAREMESALRESAAQLRHALDARDAVLRDLHDGLVQEIAAVVLSLERTSAEWVDAAPGVQLRLATCTGMLRRVLHGARELINKSPRKLGPEQLRTELESLVAMAEYTGALRLQLDLNPLALILLDDERAHHVLSVAKEAVSNTARHAQAHHCLISLQASSDSLELLVVDDGVGLPGARPKRRGRGLKNMAARASQVNGRFTVEGAAGTGTTIRFSMKIPGL